MSFIDYENAFDSVEIPAIMEALRNQGVQEAYGNILGNTKIAQLPDFSPRKVENCLLRKVSGKETISPMLFTACLEVVFNLLGWEGLRVRINGDYLSNFRFADDTVLFSNTGDELQQMIENLNRETVRVGLKINMQAKVMFTKLPRKQEFLIASRPLEISEEYVYQGYLLTGDPDHVKKIYKRIKIG